MKNVIKLITPVVLMLLFAMSSSAQTAATKVKDGKQCDPKACTKVCDIKNCDPKLCDLLAPQCKKGMKTSVVEASSTTADNATRVAAASAERTPAESTTKPACASGTSKKCCAKKEK